MDVSQRVKIAVQYAHKYKFEYIFKNVLLNVFCNLQFCPEDGGCKCDADNGFIRDNSSGECIEKEACTKKKCAGKKK